MDNPETLTTIKNGQSRDTDNIGNTKTQDEDKQNKNTTQKPKTMS